MLDLVSNLIVVFNKLHAGVSSGNACFARFKKLKQLKMHFFSNEISHTSWRREPCCRKGKNVM